MRSHLVLFISLTLGSRAALALACPITRQLSTCPRGSDCASLAESDFAKYRQQQIACGVAPTAAPYIETTAPGQASRGTVVLVHGLSANPALVRSMADKLKSQGYNVVAPILTGHGGSDELLAHSRLEDWKADVKFAGDVGSKLPPPLFIMGHSTGGTLASLEASSRPRMYKAVVGLDPALNLNAPKGRLSKLACLGQSFMTFASSIAHPFNSLTQANCQRDLHQEEVLKRKAEITDLVDKFCAQDTRIPPMNYDFPLAAVCNLSKATEELTPQRLAQMPPSLEILSKEPQIYDLISKADLKQSVLQASASNRVIQSAAPNHKLMTTACSPTFESDMRQSTAWLEKHRGSVASVSLHNTFQN